MANNHAEIWFNPLPQKPKRNPHTPGPPLCDPKSQQLELFNMAWNYFKELRATLDDDIKTFESDTLKTGLSEWEQGFRGLNEQNQLVTSICLKGYTFWVRRMLT
jgi:hypothetical protein